MTPPPPASPTGTARHDNPIALAGLMVSVLGLVLALVVIGGFIGIAGFVLSAIAFRRSRRRGIGGRGVAVGGMMLGVLAVLASVAGFFYLLALIDSGDPTVRDGIASTSRNTEFPPQDDYDGIDCEQSTTGLVARATVTLTNRSTSASVYQVVVEWDTESGDAIDEVVTTDYVDPDETIEFDVLELSGDAVFASCRVTTIERSTFPFFT